MSRCLDQSSDPTDSQADSKIWIVFCRNGSSTSLGGELLLGGMDEELFIPPINWLPVTLKGYWQIKIDA